MPQRPALFASSQLPTDASSMTLRRVLLEVWQSISREATPSPPSPHAKGVSAVGIVDFTDVAIAGAPDQRAQSPSTAAASAHPATHSSVPSVETAAECVAGLDHGRLLGAFLHLYGAALAFSSQCILSGGDPDTQTPPVFSPNLALDPHAAMVGTPNTDLPLVPQTQCVVSTFVASNVSLLSFSALNQSASLLANSAWTSVESAADNDFVSGAIVADVCPAAKRLSGQAGNGEDDAINQYTVIAELGRGAQGRVLLGVDPNNRTYAIKVVRKPKRRPVRLRRQLTRENQLSSDSLLLGSGTTGDDSDNVTTVMREIAVMKKLRHKNLVRLLEVIEDDAEGVVYLVMQYIENGPVAKQLGDGSWTTLGEDLVRRYLADAACGLAYMHKHGILHRDIKPDNILIDKHNVAYLADFGISTILGDNCVGSAAVGTLPFMAPEFFSAVPILSEATDVWALGVTAYVLLYGRLPFAGCNKMATIRAIVLGSVTFPAHATMAQRDLLSQLLAKQPTHRIPVVDMQHHKFFHPESGHQPGSSSALQQHIESVSLKTSVAGCPPVRAVLLRRGLPDGADGNNEGPVDVTAADVAQALAKHRVAFSACQVGLLTQSARRIVAAFVTNIRLRVAHRQMKL